MYSHMVCAENVVWLRQCESDIKCLHSANTFVNESAGLDVVDAECENLTERPTSRATYRRKLNPVAA